MNTEAPQQKDFRQPRWIVSTLLAISLILLAASALWPKLWFTTLFSLVPLFFAIKINHKWGTLGSFFVGFLHCCLVMYPVSTLNTWWWTVSDGFLSENMWLVYFLACMVLSFAGNLFTFAPIFYFFSKWRRLAYSPYFLIIILPAAWTLLEIIRVNILGGLEWAVFGQSLGENLFFARAASFGGLFALSFIAILFNFCLFLILEGACERKDGIKKTKILFPGLIILVFLVFLGLNNHSVAQLVAQRAGATGELSNVALISPNLQTSELADQAGIDYVFGLIEKALNSRKLDLIVLPENIFPTISIDQSTLLPTDYEQKTGSKNSTATNFDKLLQISAENPEISFILGLHSSVGDERSKKNFNSAIVLENGKIISLYNKRELLPFTEKSYSFLESVHIEPLSSGKSEKNAFAGEFGEFLDTKHGKFAPLICSEILVAKKWGENPENPAGAENFMALVNLSNDNIFDSPRIASYNKIITRIRAIQSGRPIIRASKGGFTGIFDQTGREIPSEIIADGEVVLTHF